LHANVSSKLKRIAMKAVSALIVMVALWSAATAMAQVSPMPASTNPSNPVGGNLGHVVEDLERATRFYREVLGLRVSPSSLVVPPWGGPMAPGATVEMPGANWVLELVQAPAGAAPFQPLMQDRGALTLVFDVENIRALLERARAAKATVASTGGGLVAVAGRAGVNSATMVQAPDGEFMELLEPWRDQDGVPAVVRPETGIVKLLRAVRVTVTNADQAAQAYRQLLSVDFRGGPRPVGDPGVQFMVGLPAKEFQIRIARSGLPGSGMTLELFEVAGLGATSRAVPFRSPGTSFLRLSAPAAVMADFPKSSEVANLFLVPLTE